MSTKKKRILFVVVIIILVCCVFAGSYAFWTVTKEQTDTNNLVAACLDLELIEETGTFGVNTAWPISDEEGLKLEGYSFKVKNNCSETVNYIIGIDSLAIEGATYLSNDSIKVSLDSGSPKVFNSLIDIERDNVRDSKQVEIKSIEENATNSHNIKLWIKNDADVSEQSKQFKGQVFITGGQGIASPRAILATGDISKTEQCTKTWVLDSETGEYDQQMNCIPVTGNNVTYSLSKLPDNTAELHIEGTGAIKNYEDDAGGLTYELITKVVPLSDDENMLLADDDLGDDTFMDPRIIKTVVGIKNYSLFYNNGTDYEIGEGALKDYYGLGVDENYTNNSKLAVIKKIYDGFPLISKITIDEGITEIGANAFSYMRLFNNTLTLPVSLKKINYFSFLAFDGDVILNEGLEYIGSESFASSTMATSSVVVLPSTVVNFAGSNFQDTHDFAVETVVVPTSVTTIENGLHHDLNYCFRGSERQILQQQNVVLDLTGSNITWNCEL